MSIVFRGSVFTGGRVVRTGVRVEDGRIAAVAEGDLGLADAVVELGEHQILAPAGIDGLCALRDWAEAPRDTVETATKAALAGGVTFVCDQANTAPRLNTPELVRRRTETVADKSYVDFGIGAHPPRESAALAEYRDAGVLCLQIFPWDMRPWNEPRDTDDSAETFRTYADAGLGALFFVDDLGLRDVVPDQSETYALPPLLRRLSPGFRARLMVTLADSVETILEAKDRLPDVLIQLAPFSALISREAAYARIGSAAFNVPPLREQAQVDRLHALVETGAIDLFASHHAPHRTADKYSADPVPGEYTPKAGFSTIDYAYPLLATKFGFEVACRTYCETPARAFGLNKGRIEAGFEADLVIFDEDPGIVEGNMHLQQGVTEGVWKVEPSRFQSLGKVTPFVGQRLKYRVARTYLRGEEAYDAASGRFTRRPVRQARA